MRTVFVMSALAGILACGASPTPGTNTSDPSVPAENHVDAGEEPAERPTMTVEECEARGTVVGDIGDGAVHRPDYRCPNGQPPIGTVPLGIEGSVCCPG